MTPVRWPAHSAQQATTLSSSVAHCRQSVVITPAVCCGQAVQEEQPLCKANLLCEDQAGFEQSLLLQDRPHTARSMHGHHLHSEVAISCRDTCSVLRASCLGEAALVRSQPCFVKTKLALKDSNFCQTDHTQRAACTGTISTVAH